MARRASLGAAWAKAFQRSATTFARQGTKVVQRSVRSALKSATKQAGATVRRHVNSAVKQAAAARRPPAGAGTWVSAAVVGPAGVRRYWLYRPPGVQGRERRPLLVMLHGCAQDALGFAHSTRVHRLAARDRAFVLWPEQDRLAQPQGCWNWYGTRAGQAQAEAATLMAAIDQVTLLNRIDRQRVAIAGLSAGASMAALMVTQHPERFAALVMHSGVPPGTAHSAATAIGAMTGHRARHAPPLAPAADAAESARPPLLVIHGAADPVVAAANGQAAAQQWAAAVGARAGAPREVKRGRRRAMTVTDFKRQRRTRVTLYEVQGLGHAWSGASARLPFGDPTGPDASRLLWAFVMRHWRAETAS